MEHEEGTRLGAVKDAEFRGHPSFEDWSERKLGTHSWDAQLVCTAGMHSPGCVTWGKFLQLP